MRGSNDSLEARMHAEDKLGAGDAPWDMISLKAALNKAPPGVQPDPNSHMIRNSSTLCRGGVTDRGVRIPLAGLLSTPAVTGWTLEEAP